MKLQARNFVVRKPETIDITMFFKKFCIATRIIPRLAIIWLAKPWINRNPTGLTTHP